jgi:hypothetical protein
MQSPVLFDVALGRSNILLRISAIVDACFRLIVDAISA